MCHENKMGAAKEQHPYIICRLDKQKWWNSGTAVEQSGTVTRPLFTVNFCVRNGNRWNLTVIDTDRLYFLRMYPQKGR